MTEGGISTGTRRTYVLKGCSYIKVDVEFKAVGRPERDQEGRVTLVQDGREYYHQYFAPILGVQHSRLAPAVHLHGLCQLPILSEAG